MGRCLLGGPGLVVIQPEICPFEPTGITKAGPFIFDSPHQCQGQTSSGRPCKVPADRTINGLKLCHLNDPNGAHQLAQRRLKGLPPIQSELHEQERQIALQARLDWQRKRGSHSLR